MILCMYSILLKGRREEWREGGGRALMLLTLLLKEGSKTGSHDRSSVQAQTSNLAVALVQVPALPLKTCMILDMWMTLCDRSPVCEMGGVRAAVTPISRGHRSAVACKRCTPGSSGGCASVATAARTSWRCWDNHRTHERA